MNKAVISLGSNIASEKNIAKAREILSQEYKVIAESRFILTKPIGPIAQPDFLNGAVYIETHFPLEAVEKNLKNIESRLGRIKTKEKHAPRTIDLDIVVWNNQIVDQDFYTRDYLKASILEILPQLRY
jgi:2-amino-4-hydroxy-6-hydroxymethyldihydropteridine diphosphokinase